MHTVPMPKIDYSKGDQEQRYKNGKFLIDLLERVKADPLLSRILQEKMEVIRNEG